MEKSDNQEKVSWVIISDLIAISKGNTAGGKLLKLKDSIGKEENAEHNPFI